MTQAPRTKPCSRCIALGRSEIRDADPRQGWCPECKRENYHRRAQAQRAGVVLPAKRRTPKPLPPIKPAQLKLRLTLLTLYRELVR